MLFNRCCFIIVVGGGVVIIELNGEEWLLLADAFKQLLMVLHVIITDLPDDYLDDEFIELIRDHWDVDMIYYKETGSIEINFVS